MEMTSNRSVDDAFNNERGNKTFVLTLLFSEVFDLHTTDFEIRTTLIS